MCKDKHSDKVAQEQTFSAKTLEAMQEAKQISRDDSNHGFSDMGELIQKLEE